MHIEILDSAQEDLRSAMLFYESQQRGIGEYFIDAISADIDSLLLYAGIHPKRYGYHYMLSKRFPYTIYYKVAGDTVRVYAVLDDRQDPQNHTDKLGQGK